MTAKQEYEDVVKKVVRIADESEDFTESERAALHKVARVWINWGVLARAGKWVFIGIIAIGSGLTTIIAAWSAIKSGIK